MKRKEREWLLRYVTGNFSLKEIIDGAKENKKIWQKLLVKFNITIGELIEWKERRLI